MSHRLLLLCATLSSVVCLGADPVPTHEASRAVQAEIQSHNQIQDPTLWDMPESVVRPFAEYETTRYVIMSGDDSFESPDVKRAIATNLPDGVDLVILSNRGKPSVASIQQFFAPYMDLARLHVIPVESGGTGFWARDGVPIPVYLEGGALGVVDAKYYHHFEPDTFIASAFNVPLLSHTYYYEGGNFLADHRGNCLLIDRSIPDVVFTRYYGCQTVTRLPGLAGIGHIDERIKFLSDSIALTDRVEYVPTLEGLGYTVHLLPRPRGRYETYANSLLVNGTLFLPVYDDAKDALAVETYEKFGLKTVPVGSKGLSNFGHGSIHCITMGYPEASLAEVHALLDAHYARR